MLLRPGLSAQRGIPRRGCASTHTRSVMETPGPEEPSRPFEPAIRRSTSRGWRDFSRCLEPLLAISAQVRIRRRPAALLVGLRSAFDAPRELPSRNALWKALSDRTNADRTTRVTAQLIRRNVTGKNFFKNSSRMVKDLSQSRIFPPISTDKRALSSQHARNNKNLGPQYRSLLQNNLCSGKGFTRTTVVISGGSKLRLFYVSSVLRKLSDLREAGYFYD